MQGNPLPVLSWKVFTSTPTIRRLVSNGFNVTRMTDGGGATMGLPLTPLYPTTYLRIVSYLNRRSNVIDILVGKWCRHHIEIIDQLRLSGLCNSKRWSPIEKGYVSLMADVHVAWQCNPAEPNRLLLSPQPWKRRLKLCPHLLHNNMVVRSSAASEQAKVSSPLTCCADIHNPIIECQMAIYWDYRGATTAILTKGMAITRCVS